MHRTGPPTHRPRRHLSRADVVVGQAAARAGKAELVLRRILADDGAGLAVGHTQSVHGVELGADEVGRGGERGAERAEEGLAGPVGEDQAGAARHNEVVAGGEDILDDDAAVGAGGRWVLCGGLDCPGGEVRWAKGEAWTYGVGTLEEVVGRGLLALEATESLEALVAALKAGGDDVEGYGGPLDEVVEEEDASLVALRGVGGLVGGVEGVVAVEGLDANASLAEAGSGKAGEGEDKSEFHGEGGSYLSGRSLSWSRRSLSLSLGMSSLLI